MYNHIDNMVCVAMIRSPHTGTDLPHNYTVTAVPNLFVQCNAAYQQKV